MVKGLVFFGVFCLVFTFGNAKIANQCYDDETDHFWNVGTDYNPIGRCITITCESADVMSALTCPLFVPESGCRVGEQDLTKPYPSCCPIQVC